MRNNFSNDLNDNSGKLAIDEKGPINNDRDVETILWFSGLEKCLILAFKNLQIRKSKSERLDWSSTEVSLVIKAGTTSSGIYTFEVTKNEFF